MARKPRVPMQPSVGLSSNPFAGLRAALGESAPCEPALARQPAAAATRERTPAEPAPSSPTTGVDHVELVGKLVVRREKKGRGGKTATVIDGLQLRGPSLAALAQRLRRELGCGSHVEDSRIVISGSQAERVAAWLRSLGAKTVILGN